MIDALKIYRISLALALLGALALQAGRAEDWHAVRDDAGGAARPNIVAVPGKPVQAFRPTTATGLASGVRNGSLAYPKAGLGAPSVVSSFPVPKPSAWSRGKIDGSGVNRHSFAPAGLGGPAKPVAGINGTAFRPRH